jgi:hypothetical protein
VVQRGDNSFARDLIDLSLGESGLREFGHYPLFLAVQRAFVRSQGSPQGRPEVRALVEDPSGAQCPSGWQEETIRPDQLAT